VARIGYAALLLAAAALAPADHSQENKAVVRRYLLEALAAGSAEHLDDIVAATFTDRSSGATPNQHGPAAVRAIQKRLHALAAKLEYDLQDMVAEEDRVAARYVVQVTPRAEPRRPAPAPFLANGAAFFRVQGGKIQEVYVLNDQLTILRQLGYSVLPPGAAAAPPAAPAPPAAAPGTPPPPP
jgi:predicted ester cyclase